MTRWPFLLGAAFAIACGGTVTVPGDAGADASTDATTGADASNDAATDASAPDAYPECPAVRPQRLTACSPVDWLCVYPCGVAMRCGASGWDYDTVYDAGPPCP